MKIIFISEFFEESALALHLRVLENQDVKVMLRDQSYKKILEGIIEKEDDVFQYLGQGNLFVFGDAASGSIAEHLRQKGELVFGGTPQSDKMENDRQEGIKWAKRAGITVPWSKNFKGEEAINQAKELIKSKPMRYVIKQNGDQDKSLSTVGKFEDGIDILDKLDDFTRIMDDPSKIDFDIEECIDGHEVASEIWFNGNDVVRDKSGEPVVIVNWEHKKNSVGDLGRTTGETGTLAVRVRNNSPIAQEILKMVPLLKEINYVGNCDINFMLSEKDKKFYFLEFTMRFGYPMLNLQQEIFKNRWTDLLLGCATGKNNCLDVEYDKWGVVVVVKAPPFPFESTKDTNNAKGQRIYFIDKGKWKGEDSLPIDKLRHIHFYEVKYDKEQDEYLCAGDTGYVMTVTGQGDYPEEANNKALKNIKDNIYTSNMDFRNDIGVNKRIEDGIKFMIQENLL